MRGALPRSPTLPSGGLILAGPARIRSIRLRPLALGPAIREQRHAVAGASTVGFGSRIATTANAANRHSTPAMKKAGR